MTIIADDLSASVTADPVNQVGGAPLGRDTGPLPEEEPDVRLIFANERTFLAWNRTALALIATGVAATQLLPSLHVVGGRRLLGLPLIVLGAVVAAISYRHWQANGRAMRRGEPLPRSLLPVVVSVGIGLVAMVGVALVVLAGSRP